MPTFWQVFIINGCWILSKAFPPSIEMMIWFLFFSLLMWHITLICRHWSILSSLGWIPLAHCVWSFWCIVRFSLLYFGEDFLRLCSSMILAYFFFWWYLCLILVSGWWWPHWVWECSFLCNFLERIGISEVSEGQVLTFL